MSPAAEPRAPAVAGLRSRAGNGVAGAAKRHGLAAAAAAPGVTGWARLVVGRHPRRTLLRLAVLAAAAWLLGRYVARPVWINGPSMEPTYRDGTLHVANLLEFRARAPRPGAVVVIRMAGESSMYLKRVLAGPGDAVAFRDGVLLVNGAPRPEPYVVRPGRWNVPETRAGPDEFFVAGDNRATPAEAHVMGLVRRARIAGGMLW